MARISDILLTALAPAIWGSTYLITTELLPPGHPITVAMIRTLPAGLMLLALLRVMPSGIWFLRAFILGALNFTIFQTLLFVSAYRLPGGIAATMGAVQPLIVIFVAALILKRPIRRGAILAALAGLVGVGLLVVQSHARLDTPGMMAALGGALSMAFGTVLTRKWSPEVPPLLLTAWQLTAGGLLLLPVALIFEPRLQHLTPANLGGFAYLIVLTALTYVLWFRGVARIEPSAVSTLSFLSPFVAILLGWAILGQALSWPQIAGAVIVLLSILASQRVARLS